MTNSRFHLRGLILTFFVLLVWQGALFGQKPANCRSENKNDGAPKYRIGWKTYSNDEPKIFFVAISIHPRYFSRESMVRLARRLKQDFCREQRLIVEILDNHRAARSFYPTSEIEWFHVHWRGRYTLDSYFGTEEFVFSTTPDKPKDEVK